MTKILEQASRALAIMGIALIVWAGMGAQTAKAIVIPFPFKANCRIQNNFNPDGTAAPDTCTALICEPGACCQAAPLPLANGGKICCYLLAGQAWPTC